MSGTDLVEWEKREELAQFFEAQGYIAEDYASIPGYTRYRVNPMGDVWDTVKLKFMNPYRGKDGYVTYSIKSDSGNRSSLSRHRAVALTFVKPPITDEYLIVNHIDGIPGNDWVSNLEWVTYQGNLEHAGRLGLTSKCVPISVRDVDTGEVKHYASFVKRAEEVGVSKDYIAYRLKFPESRVFPERKQYRRYDGDAPWDIPEDIERALLVNDTDKAVALKYHFTGVEMIFNKLTDLSTFLGVSMPTISAWANREGQPMLPDFIQIKKLVKGEPWRKVENAFLELQNNSGRKLVKITNSKTGESKIYESCVEGCKEMGIGTTCMNYRLGINRETPWQDGYIYQYYTNTLE